MTDLMTLHIQNNRISEEEKRTKREKIARSIERDIKKRWGWKIDVTVSSDGDLAWDGNREVNKDRYDMYPEMSHEDADKVVMDEILAIIRKYLPDFRYTSYEQSGQMHYE